MQCSVTGSLVCVRIPTLLCIPSSRLVICCNLSLNLAFKSFVLAHSAQTWITTSLSHTLMAFTQEEGVVLTPLCHVSWALLPRGAQLSKSRNVFGRECPKCFRCESGTQKKGSWELEERWFAQTASAHPGSIQGRVCCACVTAQGLEQSTSISTAQNGAGGSACVKFTVKGENSQSSDPCRKALECTSFVSPHRWSGLPQTETFWHALTKWKTVFSLKTLSSGCFLGVWDQIYQNVFNTRHYTALTLPGK